jgi:hypothetical protein
MVDSHKIIIKKGSLYLIILLARIKTRNETLEIIIKINVNIEIYLF